MIQKIIIGIVAIVLAMATVPFFQKSASVPSTQPVATALPVMTTSAKSPAAVKATMQRVELSEQDVNQILRDGLLARGYKVDDLVVHLEEGRFLATTTQQVSFFRLPVTITGGANVVDGKVLIESLNVSAAGAALPQDVVDQMAASFRTELAAQIDQLPVRPTSVQIRPGQLVVEGEPK